MKFSISAAALLALSTGALSAAVKARQNPACSGYQSAGTLPHDTNWGGYSLCCDYEGPSGNNVSSSTCSFLPFLAVQRDKSKEYTPDANHFSWQVAEHCCDRNGVNTGSGAPACV